MVNQTNVKVQKLSYDDVGMEVFDGGKLSKTKVMQMLVTLMVMVTGVNGAEVNCGSLMKYGAELYKEKVNDENYVHSTGKDWTPLVLTLVVTFVLGEMMMLVGLVFMGMVEVKFCEQEEDRGAPDRGDAYGGENPDRGERHGARSPGLHCDE